MMAKVDCFFETLISAECVRVTRDERSGFLIGQMEYDNLIGQGRLIVLMGFWHARVKESEEQG